MTPIEDAVNIGPDLAGEAGIESRETLQTLGYSAAWEQLRTVAPDRDCTHTCLALAGAIVGARWISLPAETRAEIANVGRGSGECHEVVAAGQGRRRLDPVWPDGDLDL